jgi:hypothetical protein
MNSAQAKNQPNYWPVTQKHNARFLPSFSCSTIEKNDLGLWFDARGVRLWL